MDLIQIILINSLPCILLALGIYLTYRILDFADLSAEGSLLIGGGVTIAAIEGGMNPFIATLLGFIGGSLCGVLTGCLNRFLKIPKLLSGIITMTAAGGIIFLIFGKDMAASSTGDLVFVSEIKLDMDVKDTIFSIFFTNSDGFLNNQMTTILVMLVCVILVMVGVYFFFGTEYGMAIRSTGINENMSKAQGINTTVSTIVCIAISNGLIGLAGSLMAQKNASITLNDSVGYLVIGLASILIGEAVFGKRSFKNCLISIALGTIIYFVIIEVAYKLGFPTQLNKLLYAILIVIALCLPMIKTSISNLFRKIFMKKQEVK